MSPLRWLRCSPVVRGRGSAGASAAGGALVALLALGPIPGKLAARWRPHLGLPDRMEPYLGFVLVFVVAMVGVAGGAGLFLGARRLRRPWIAPLLLLVAAAALGALRARWLGYVAPLSVLTLAPWLAPGRERPASLPAFEKVTALVCLACEGACAAVGLWCPYAADVPALLVPMMAVGAGLAAFGAARLAHDRRWRWVAAALPALAMPFVGLHRNPDLRPLRLAILVACVLLAAFARFPSLAERAATWARRRALVLCLPAVSLVLLLPWHFRDMGAADHAGHEGQHLGWINSIHFGKMMMADAGFTYGPLREYALAALAKVLGGPTLETVRLSHVALNVLGLVLLFAVVLRVARRQLHLALLGLALVLTHTALVALMTYQQTYSFGWADATRAGLAIASLVVALTRPRTDAMRSRRAMGAAGLLCGLALLYSHDQGVPAAVATLLGLGAETLVRRAGLPWKARARAALEALRAYGVGVLAVVVPFVTIYAAYGKLGALVAGYRWTFEVSRGAAPFVGALWTYGWRSFGSYADLTHVADPDGSVDARVLDFVMGPVLALAGFAHVVVALVTRRVSDRTALVLALAAMQAATLLHVFMAADPWHIDNATSSGLVLLVALLAGGGTLRFRLRRAVLPVGAVAGLALPLVWLATCSHFTLNLRLLRIAKGDELPSFGAPYTYENMPRAGDVGMQNTHVEIVKYIREHTKPSDPVYCTTWLLGGGTEAFLSERRNPTSFDKPDEIVSDAQRALLLRELQADPPALIVGTFYDYVGKDVRNLIDTRYENTSAPTPGARARKK